MTEKAKEIRQTFSTLKAVGILKEAKLEIEPKKFDDGAAYNTLKGNIVISVNGTEHKFRIWINDHFASLNDEGKHKGNRTYDAVYPLINAQVGDMVELELRAERFNDYVNQRGSVTSVDDLNITSAKTISPDAEQMFDGRIEGSIYSIRPEIVREEETGRLIVTFVGVGYGQKALPHTIYVDAEMADGFQNEYEVGDCCMLDITIEGREYGMANEAQSSGWGLRKARVSNGFTRIEWLAIDGGIPYEEEQINKDGQPLLISQSDIKSLMEARDIMLEQIEKEGYKGGNKGESKQGLKAMNKPDVDLTDVECPF